MPVEKATRDELGLLMAGSGRDEPEETGEISQ
jgi:hypothetical protein